MSVADLFTIMVLALMVIITGAEIVRAIRERNK